MAACEGNVDEQHDFHKNNNMTQLDNDDEGNSQAGGVTKTPVEEDIQADGDSHNVGITDHIRGTNPHFVVTHYNDKGSAGVIPEVPKVVHPIIELTLDQFTNNYHIFAQKLVETNIGLVISALLLKTKKLFIIIALKFLVQKMYTMQRLLLQM